MKSLPNTSEGVDKVGFLPDRSQVVIRHVLERHCTQRPDNECFIFENGKRWTYRETLREAYRAANALYKLQIKRDETVLIFLPNDASFIRAWLGVNFLGAVMVLVNTAYKGEMLRHICKDSISNYIITTSDLAERIADFGLNLNVIDPAILTEGSSDEPKLDKPIEPWNIAAIIYTSGTTGPSKGVITPYFSMFMSSFRYRDRAKNDDTLLVDIPLFHIGALNNVNTLIGVGGRIALFGTFSSSRYWERVRECGATLCLLVGTMQDFLIAMPPQPDDADNPLRAVRVTPMVSNPDAFMARFGIEELYSGYGMTETNLVLIDGPKIRKPKSCGKVIERAQVQLVDEQDILVLTGEIGELIVRTELPWRMNAGYWRRPEETAFAWRNGWFHTGDLFYCDDEGYYFFVDRKKDAIRRRGENISSFEVEREVMAYPDVLEVACIGVPAEFGEDEVKIFVVPRKGSKFDAAELIRFLIPRMPYFMVPRFVEVVPEFPKTPTMRIKKYELRARGNRASTWDREGSGITVKRCE